MGDASEVCVGTKEEIIYIAYFWPGHLAVIAGAGRTDGLLLVPTPSPPLWSPALALSTPDWGLSSSLPLLQ